MTGKARRLFADFVGENPGPPEEAPPEPLAPEGRAESQAEFTEYVAAVNAARSAGRRAPTLKQWRAERAGAAPAAAALASRAPARAVPAPPVLKCIWCATISAADLPRCTHCGAPRS